MVTGSEIFSLLTAGIVLLSTLGVNVSALLLPAGIALAVAAKDLSHNFLAGFFLFVVQVGQHRGGGGVEGATFAWDT